MRPFSLSRSPERNFVGEKNRARTQVRKKGRGRTYRLNYCFVMALWLLPLRMQPLTCKIADSISSHERRFTMVTGLNRDPSFEYDIRLT